MNARLLTVAGVSALLLFGVPCAGGKGKEEKRLSSIDRYIQEASARAATQRGSPGSLYSPTGVLADVARDLRATQVDDLVTIVVLDKASAVSRGGTNTARKSSAKSSISSLFGPTNVGGALANLTSLGGQQQLQGQGETTRETLLTTTISARVVDVLPNGYLVVEGLKETWINSEHQQVSIRGVVRWNDLDQYNRVSSDRLANLEVRVNGKGVVGDAVRRPNFLWRLLLGLLPF
jgi:flagellar L-ring protein precursor FlgH